MKWIFTLNFIFSTTFASELSNSTAQFVEERDRIGAANFLMAYVGRKLSKEKEQEALRLWDRVAEQFFSEKALRDYQLAESVFQRDRKRAMEMYKKILAEEPLNVLVVGGLVDALLVTDACRDIRETMGAVENLFPRHKLVQLKEVQELDCLGKPESIPSLLEKANALIKENPSLELAQYYRLKWMVGKGNLLESAQDLKKLEGGKLDQLPELWFLRWEVEPLAAKKKQFAEMYLSQCDRLGMTPSKPFRSVREWCTQKEKMTGYIKGMSRDPITQ